MEAISEIEVRVTGLVGGLELQPALTDIQEIQEMLARVENLLFPVEKRSQRPIVSYEIQPGSVRHVFRTLSQTVLGLGAVLGQISAEHSIDFLHQRSAEAIEQLQEYAVRRGYAVELKAAGQSLRIDKNTHYRRTEALWAEAEFYFYGDLTNAGGKDKANIHLSTEEYGSLRIATPKDFLAESERNLLYKKFGVRARGRQNVVTGEVDTGSLDFVELLDYSEDYDEAYLNAQIAKAAPAWAGVTDSDAWLKEIRGDEREDR